MLARFLHWLAAKPWIYDRIQALAGAATVNRHLSAALQPLLKPAVEVLDVGGGTGLARELFPPDSRYTLLDNDPVKLAGYRQKYPDGRSLLADGTRIPVETASVDIVLCRFVTHHVPDEQLPDLLGESARVLKPSGSLVFVEALRENRRPISRLMWRYDRGSHPREEADLRARLAQRFQVIGWDRFAVFHPYVVAVARPVPQPCP